jgi:hypothetical protein
MDLTFKGTLCPACGTDTMHGHGASFGGTVEAVKIRCMTCRLTLLIIPMRENLEYNVSATTAEERIENRIAKARKESELALARTITRIKETGF